MLRRIKEENVPLKKMPVSFLSELCERKQFKPIYTLRSATGEGHDQIFVVDLTVGDISGSGRAKNKKLAKHFAARDVLYGIIEKGPFREWYIAGNTPEEASTFLKNNLSDIDTLPGAILDPTTGGVANAPAESVSENASNPVGQLLELCDQNCWPMPQFDTIEESGLCHDKTFVIKVVLGPHERIASAKTKKLAKRKAAEALSEFLSSKTPDELGIVSREPAENDNGGENMNVKVDSENSSLDLTNKETFKSENSKSQNYVDMESSSFDSSNQNGDGRSLLRTDLPNSESNSAISTSDGKPPFWAELQELDFNTATPSEYHTQFLRQIADYHDWKLVYTSAEKRCASGNFQSVVSLASGKYATFGSGETSSQAEYSAALNLLDLLKMKE